MEEYSFTQQEVIFWIHSVECGKPVRMAALITELFFSRKLNKQIGSGRFSSVADGWFFVDKESAAGVIRHWFRLSHDGDAPNAAELKFFESFSTLGHRFFFLIPSLSAGAGPRGLALIDVKTMQLLSNGSAWHAQSTSLACELGHYINNKLASYLNEIPVTLQDPFSKWLVPLGIDILVRMYVQRCLMNSLKEWGPLDLDGVGLTRAGDLVLLEFKRKYPAKGRSEPIKEANKPDDYCVLAEKVLMQVGSVGGLSRKQIREKYNVACSRLGFYYRPRPSFGLDMKHFDTVLLCEELGVEYKYIIWLSGSDEKSSRSLDDELAGLNKSLNYSLGPARRIEWWMRVIKAADVKGISYTAGADSGSYTQKLRIQVAFDL